MQEELFRFSVRLGYGLLLVWLVWQRWLTWHSDDKRIVTAPTRSQARQHHAQSPRDCPACQVAEGTGSIDAKRVVEPWSTQKSRRGRPKTVDTEGHSCPNPRCVYY